jgi:AcrR family transcriptional regulator
MLAMAPDNDYRERALSAAMSAIAERGMSALRMEDVGRRAGMSPGHILYYYRSKQKLLIETLRWSEDHLAEQRARDLATPATSRERLQRFISIYLPAGPGDPEWLLWLHVYAATAENRDVVDVTDPLFGRWLEDLAAIIEHGCASGEFAPTDPHCFAEEFLAMLDGLSVHVLRVVPALDRERAAAVALDIAGCRLGFDEKGTCRDRR